MRRRSEQIEGCYQVHDHLLAGVYPAGWGERQITTMLRNLLRAGVTSFLDLTEEEEKDLPPYEPLLREAALEVGRAAQYRRIAIPDFETPTAEQMRAILDALDASLADGHTVYLHCYAGIGRTGTAVACYLVRHGRNAESALEELAHLRQGTSLAGIPSPATEEQRQLVYAWASLDRGGARVIFR